MSSVTLAVLTAALSSCQARLVSIVLMIVISPVTLWQSFESERER